MAELTRLSALPPIVPGSSSSGVDLWCFFYERVSDPGLLHAYQDLMTPDERKRHESFVFDRDRDLFLATRALVRTVLSAYADVDPHAWRFAEGERGKPYIAKPVGIPLIHFNLTNTRGLVVCAVSRVHRQVGVDAEWLDRPGETLSLAEGSFSLLEARTLRALPAARQRDRFFSYWTLKESYIKARGLGLAIPLDQFWFLLDDDPRIRIGFDPRLADVADRWRFQLLSASPSHMVAVGVDTGGPALTLTASNFVPLRGTLPFEQG